MEELDSRLLKLVSSHSVGALCVSWLVLVVAEDDDGDGDFEKTVL